MHKAKTVKMANEIELNPSDTGSELELSYADGGIRAGFPSPAQDYVESGIDLNHELIRHPASTFYGRAIGDSMIEAGITEGDILVIDKSLEPQNGDMAVCFINGEFTLKFIEIDEGKLFLQPANKAYSRIEVTPESQFQIWGIVTYTIKKRNKRI